jgi:hypothetical protein
MVKEFWKVAFGNYQLPSVNTGRFPQKKEHGYVSGWVA